MSLFDNVAEGQILMSPETVLTESVEDTEEEVMLESMYPMEKS